MKEQRIAQLMVILERLGTIQISQACEIFGVAPMTIRRDLDYLEGQGLISRTHGGARLISNSSLVERSFGERLTIQTEYKQAIARLASSTIYSGERIFISSGSTMHFLTFFLDNSRSLFVITNSLHIASELVNRSNITLIMIGGEVRHNTLSVTGALADDMVSKFHCNKAYMGLTSIDGEGNLYLGSMTEAGILATQFKNTPECYLLADYTKLGKKDFVQVGKLGPRTKLITNANADRALLAAYKEMGTEILLA